MSTPAPPNDIPSDIRRLARQHLRFGWWSLLVFLCLGAVLESMHGFKVQFYVAVAHEARRLLWTLAHAHGTLLALIHIVFALSLPILVLSPACRTITSRCLYAAAILLPAGFFLGGLFIHDGDPGLGVLLVPPAALMLLLGVLLAARGTGGAGAPPVAKKEG